MNYQDRIIELNFDTDNEEAQIEAKKMRKHLLLLFTIFLTLSIPTLLISIGVFIICIIFALNEHEVMMLYSILPLTTIVLSLMGIVYAVSRKSLANEIIIINEK